MRCHTVCRASPAAAACFSEPAWKENRAVSPKTPHSVTSPRCLGVVSFIGCVKGRLWHSVLSEEWAPPCWLSWERWTGSIVGSRVRVVQSAWRSLTLSALGAPESLDLPATGGCTAGLTFGTSHCMSLHVLTSPPSRACTSSMLLPQH